jgi:hypothetical protein
MNTQYILETVSVFNTQYMLATVSVLIGLIVNLFVVRYVFREYYEIKNAGNTVSIMNKFKAVRHDIPVTRGVCSLDKGKVVINTFDYSKDNYVKLEPSVNMMGGAQFSYSFWLRRGADTETTLKNKIIFYRGNELKPIKEKGYMYKLGSSKDNDYIDQEHLKFQNDAIDSYRFIKSPLVRFGGKPNTMVIEFNTLKNPHMEVVLDSEVFTLLKSSRKNPKVKPNDDRGPGQFRLWWCRERSESGCVY